jgi:hypothetical protein
VQPTDAAIAVQFRGAHDDNVHKERAQQNVTGNDLERCKAHQAPKKGRNVSGHVGCLTAVSIDVCVCGFVCVCWLFAKISSRGMGNVFRRPAKKKNELYSMLSMFLQYVFLFFVFLDSNVRHTSVVNIERGVEPRSP